MLKKVIVASKNPVKIAAVKVGFEKMFPTQSFEFQGISVPSGVSDQPMTHRETMNGAINRADNAKKEIPTADFWVGVEGGIEKMDGNGEAFAWIYVLSESLSGKGKTGSFFLPKKIMELVDSGMELGHADDLVFDQSNSKQKSGAIGLLTGDVMTRQTLYEPAVIMALIPFKNEEFYGEI